MKTYFDMSTTNDYIEELLLKQNFAGLAKNERANSQSHTDGFWHKVEIYSNMD